MSEGSESAATEKAEKKTGKEEKEFKATNITHIADTCAVSAKKKRPCGEGGSEGVKCPPTELQIRVTSFPEVACRFTRFLVLV